MAVWSRPTNPCGVRITIDASEFNYQLAGEFLDEILKYDRGSCNFEVDFREVSAIDSSGISLLLKLSERCLPYKKIRCINLQTQVMKVLKASAFDRHFTLSLLPAAQRLTSPQSRTTALRVA